MSRDTMKKIPGFKNNNKKIELQSLNHEPVFALINLGTCSLYQRGSTLSTGEVT